MRAECTFIASNGIKLKHLKETQVIKLCACRSPSQYTLSSGRLLNEPVFTERARRISRVMRAQARARYFKQEYITMTRVLPGIESLSSLTLLPKQDIPQNGMLQFRETHETLRVTVIITFVHLLQGTPFLSFFALKALSTLNLRGWVLTIQHATPLA